MHQARTFFHSRFGGLGSDMVVGEGKWESGGSMRMEVRFLVVSI